jgi:hypothetical protein
MKRIVAVVTLVSFVLNCAPTLPQYKYDSAEREEAIIISERVGETVDTEEGEQFGLFTEIEEFKEARFFTIKDGGYIVEIVTNGDSLVGVNRDQDAVTILREYMNKHEYIIADRAGFENRWNILDHDILGIPITESEVSLTMKQSRSRAVKGGLVGCGGAILVGLVVGGGIAASGAGSGSDIGPALGAAAGLTILIAVGLGGLIGIGTKIAITYGKDESDFLKMIKEARKPRSVE